MNADKIPSRIVEGLDNIRGAVAKLHSAHIDGHSDKVCSALHIINNEYFSIRQCLDQLVEEANHKTT